MIGQLAVSQMTPNRMDYQAEDTLLTRMAQNGLVALIHLAIEPVFQAKVYGITSVALDLKIRIMVHYLKH